MIFDSRQIRLLLLPSVSGCAGSPGRVFALELIFARPCATNAAGSTRAAFFFSDEHLNQPPRLSIEINRAT